MSNNSEARKQGIFMRLVLLLKKIPVALGFVVPKTDEMEGKYYDYVRLVGGLASEYTALYHVDLNTGEYVPYHIAESIEDIKPLYDTHPKFADLAHAFAASPLVDPEYAEILRDFYPSDEAVRQALRGKKKISTLFKRNYKGEFLWTEADIIKCEDVNEEAQHVILGFIEKDAEIKHEQETRNLIKQSEEAQKLLSSMVSEYNMVYLVNMEDDSFKLLRLDSYIVGSDETFENFAEAKEYFFTKILHKADISRMRYELDYYTIKSRLKNANSYLVDYRALLGNATVWHEMKVTSYSDKEVAIGFAVKDEKIIRRRLEDKKYDEYFALFVVDFDTAMIKALKVGGSLSAIDVGETMLYDEAVRIFKEIHGAKEKEFFNVISDFEAVKAEFAVDDKRTYSFKADRVAGDEWVDVTSYVIDRHVDGSPAMITFGFSKVDALATIRKELQTRLNENTQMISGLASEYHAMYYYNISDRAFKVYSLDETRFPEAAHIVDAGTDPVEMLQNYSRSELIHPEDRWLFKNVDIEYVKRKLSHSKKFELLFRRLFEGEYLWAKMTVIKYEDVDEPANAIAIGFAECDSAIRNEQVLNSCFKVISKDIPPKHAIEEILQNVGEYYQADHAFVFEYGKNEETVNNTFEWCSPSVVHRGESALKVLSNLDAENRITVPIMNGDEIRGVMVVENPIKGKDNISILKNMAAIVFSEILKLKEHDEEHVTLTKLTETFLSVYYGDFSIDYLKTWKIADEYKDAYGAVRHYSDSMGNYVRENIAEADRARCIEQASPKNILKEFETKDRYSISMTDIMTGVDRNVVFDYIKVSEDGNQFVMCCRDVTESIEKEREQQKLLEDALTAADRANRSKTSFLFNMSHDIRTPMNAITGFTSMAKKYVNDSEKVIEYLDKIDISGKQLLSLINQVLEMARIESGKVELDEKSFNLQRGFNSMVTVLNEQAKASGLEFHYALLDMKHCNVFMDVARVGSITLNIAGNAIKYTQEGGNIDFTLREVESRKPGYGTYVLSVKDTGIGMSEDYQKILFEPFSREKNSTVSKIQGTGLGMSIVKNLVELMGGNIQVESELGRGTKFEVTVDFRIDESKSIEAEAKESAGVASFEGLRALLVEDNEMNREIARDILEDYGFIIEDANDGDMAVAMVEATLQRGEPTYYDFILMDVQMPRMDGYEATRAIRALPMPENVHIPIIAMTANAFEEDRNNALNAGMDEHLAKPIDIPRLVKTLAKFI